MPKIMLITTTAWEDHATTKKSYYKLIRTLLFALEDVQEWDVTIKPHPRERNTGYYNHLIRKYGLKHIKVKLLYSKDELYKEISESYHIITMSASTAVECILLNRTVTLFADYIGMLDLDLVRDMPQCSIVNAEQYIRALKIIVKTKVKMGVAGKEAV